jgi:uncharacterized protein (TIGR02611 family)
MATEDAAGRAEEPIAPAEPPIGTSEEGRPELLIKLQERKVRHKQRNILQRVAIVLAGILIVIAGIVMSGPGVPGPGIVTIIVGLTFLALEFDWAERWLERVIIWGDRTAERAQQTTTGQRVAAGIATLLAVGGFAVAAILWDIPLMPVL